MSGEAKKMILNMLKEGKISVEEAEGLLAALETKTEAKSEEKGAGKGPLGNELGAVGQAFNKIWGTVSDKVGEAKDYVKAEAKKQTTDRLVNDLTDRIGSTVRTVVGTITNVVEQGVDSIGDMIKAGDKYSFNEQIAAAPSPAVTQISVGNVKGDVTILGEDRQDILIDVAKVVWASSQEDAEKKVRNLHINWKQQGEKFVIDFPDMGKNLIHKDYMDLVIHAPRAIVPAVSTVSGDISVQNLAFTGEANVKTVSGDVEVKQVKGDVTIKTASGDLDLADYEGKVNLDTLSGDVAIKSARLGGDIQAFSGDLSLEAFLVGKLSYKSMSGDIEATVEVPSHAGLDASTTTGDVVVTLAEASDCTVTASTQSGEVEIQRELASQEGNKHGVKGKLNAGAAQVLVRSTSGDVLVK